MASFDNAKWIWSSLNYSYDEYAEFVFDLEIKNLNDSLVINLACDSNYILSVNGKEIAFGQYPDYPDYKVYDSVNLSNLTVGKNQIKITVWYYGVDSSTYLTDKAGLIFTVELGGDTILNSNENILSRKDITFENHRALWITTQLGYGFKKLGNVVNDLPFTNSVCIEKSKNLNPRPIDKLVLSNLVSGEPYKHNGTYIIDLKEETVGFIYLKVTAKDGDNIKIYYGEWLNSDVEIQKQMQGGGNFYVEYVCKDGVNEYDNKMRRIAGRYLQVYCPDTVKIDVMGIIPVDYPLVKLPVNFKNPLRNKIYDVAVKTLTSCMHEHYEDCPWREQALYNMDSRNEMLFTYLAFKDYRFARASLKLMAKAPLKEGILPICFPAGTNLTIPSFSLIYAVQTCEYIENSGDTEFIKEVFPQIKSVMDTFIANFDPVMGLLKRLPYPHWNFYEWSYGSDNAWEINRKNNDGYKPTYDLNLNCFFVFSLKYYKKLCSLAGVEFNFDEDGLKQKIVEHFYDTDAGLFKAQLDGEPFYTVLGNSLAILAGLGDKKMCDKLINDEKFDDGGNRDERDSAFKNKPKLVPVTLSMCLYFYDALLSVDKNYKDFVLSDMERKFKKMLDEGATTFWETELGYKDFGMRGSLCHGWSALPIRYYHLLNGKDYFDGTL
ncbi:MAG: family 78 glycoside hydrolase catalytic domain [Clostridia bacterium]|nr:family 78 glycoside hydrolase catalytic domain [Clostridia bacterium]